MGGSRKTYGGSGIVTRRTAILVIAFNRPDLLRELIRLLEEDQIANVIVSVDCEMSGTINVEILKMAQSEFPNVEWRFQKNHLGIGKHIPFIVGEILKKFDNAIVLEDDVRVSTHIIKSSLELLSERLPNKYLTVGFFGTLPNNVWSRGLFGANCWRQTEFFSAWGWAIQKESWDLYQQELDRSKLVSKILKSNMWQRKNSVCKIRWIGRFDRVAANPHFTWDYQMQYATYAYDKLHLLPVFRSADNVGFDNQKSTNTKSRRPSWYRGKTANFGMSKEILREGLKSKFLIYLDRITWSGDSAPPRVLRLLSSIMQRF